jgi:hypothetical protein
MPRKRPSPSELLELGRENHSAGPRADLTLILSRSDLADLLNKPAHDRRPGPQAARSEPRHRESPNAGRTHPTLHWRPLAVAGLLALAFVTALTVAIKPPSQPTATAKDTTARSPAGQAGLQANQPTGAPEGGPAKPSLEGGATHGTSIELVSAPAEAARQARDKNKLVFLLHVSGNFEDASLT